jgi:ribA/ribD-fused uncharacterized protein
MIEALYQVTAVGSRPFCAGLVARDDIVMEAAPILRKWINQPVQELHGFAVRTGLMFAPVSWKVTSFDGQHTFLSNFYASPMRWHGLDFRTLEHAYQWSKIVPPDAKELVRNAWHPGAAKRLARALPMRPDWDAIKVAVMLDLLRIKFAVPDLRDRLRSTGDAELVEGNTWNDTFWGICRGVGENHLGRLLMQVRVENAGG